MAKGEIGSNRPSQRSRNTWVQTERRAHERWEKLIAQAPEAARLVHVLVANMGSGNAVVASQKTLGELMAREVTKKLEDGTEYTERRPVHRNTIRKAIQKLVRDQWIEVVELGGKGGALGYVVNARVAWHGSRNDLRYAKFNAEVLASESEQSEAIDGRAELQTIPQVMHGESAIPSGPGDDPPSQTQLEGMEPVVYRDRAGHEWEHDPETGELQQRIE